VLIQLVNIKVKPGHRDTFIEAFEINCDGTRRESGNIRFDLLCDPDDENNFSVYEIFHDEAALDQHRGTEHYKKCVAMIEPITIGERTKTYYQDVLIQDSGLD
jgi:autoinducer 2-degrading protein